jgi:hypothetical protein
MKYVIILALAFMLSSCVGDTGIAPDYNANSEPSCKSGVLGTNEATGDQICWSAKK